MAVPLLAPGYLETVKQLKAQSAESAKNRAAQAHENNKQFGFDIGKALLAGGLNMGADALSKHLDLPLELAKGGGYGPDDAPAPDVTPTTPAVDDAVRGAALSVLADKVKAPPVETAPSPQPAPVTPLKPFSLKPPSAIQPETPEAQNPTFAKGLPTEETPVTKDWGGLAPRPVVAPEPTAVKPVAATPAEPSADHGIGARFKQLATDRTPAPQPEPISDTEAALRRMSKLNRRASTSESALREAQADALRAKPGDDPMAAEKLRKMKLESAKLEEDAKNAAAAYEPGTPQYESRRTKAWDDAFAAVSKTEQRASGSVNNMGYGGGSSQNKPRGIGVVVDDGNGWPRVIGADDSGRFIYREGKDSQIQYDVIYNKKLGAYQAVNARRVQRGPDGAITAAPVAVTPVERSAPPPRQPKATGAAKPAPPPQTQTPPAKTRADELARFGLPPTATAGEVAALSNVVAARAHNVPQAGAVAWVNDSRALAAKMSGEKESAAALAAASAKKAADAARASKDEANRIALQQRFTQADAETKLKILESTKASEDAISRIAAIPTRNAERGGLSKAEWVAAANGDEPPATVQANPKALATWESQRAKRNRIVQFANEQRALLLKMAPQKQASAPSAPAPANQPAPPPLRTADDVRAAFHNGRISREQAAAAFKSLGIDVQE